MVLDEVYQKDVNTVIEILVDGVYVPAMATDLRILNRDLELVRVEAIRVRNLKDEK